jgi:hypothetical protein
MPTTFPATSRHPEGGIASRVSRALLGAYLVAVLGVCALLVFKGPEMRAAAEAERGRIIEEENKDFCEKLGMPHGTADFSRCAGYLGGVRKHHAERLAAEHAGLL